jgi:sulfate adenylyltransferase subunit 1
MPWYKGQTIRTPWGTWTGRCIWKRTSTFSGANCDSTKTEEYHDFRGYAGKLYGNNIKVGDAVTVLPSLTESKVSKIHFFDKQFDEVSRFVDYYRIRKWY